MDETTLKMWWPSPEAFEDLIVEDAEHGFNLSAPDDTECGDWLAFWSQDEAHHVVFEKEFIEVLRNYANRVLENHGENEKFPDRGTENRIQAQDDQSGVQSEHEPGSDPSQPS
jgi:hypothetical protein